MKAAIVDIETTGLNPALNMIVEIAIVSLDLETGKTKIIYNELIKEQKFDILHKNSWIFNNSDLTFEEVNSAAPLDIKKLQSIFDKYHITAYNKDFDISFLQHRGFRIPNQLPCPMKLLTPILQLPSKNHYMGFKYPSLKEAWAATFPNKPYLQNHRASDDAIHEAELVYELYNRGIITHTFI